MTRRLVALALSVLVWPAAAQDGGHAPFSLRDYPERMRGAVAACEAAPEGGDCHVQLMSVLPSTIEALSFLGYESTYAESAATLRDMATFPKPEIQAAAIYALARLGPTADDLPVLREGLLSDVPGVRRAAIGALKAMADTSAQELVARAEPVPGSYFEADVLPFDPAAMGIASWPQGARFLHFQRLRDKGTYVFVAAGDVTGLVAGFEAQTGRKAVGMGDIEARFGAAYAELLKPWSERNATLGAVQAVILNDVSVPAEIGVAILALVYDDYALGAPGFAIVRLPGEALPVPRQTEVATPAPQGDAAIWYAGGAFVPKDGATEDDIAAWRAVMDAEGEGAAAYLEAFPDGAWRAEAEALAAAPAIETDLDVYAESDTIKVTWRGVAASSDTPLELVLGQVSDASVRDSVSMTDLEVTTAEGAAELTFYHFVLPGVYEVRLADLDGEVVASAEIRIALAAAQLKLDKDSYKPGEAVAVSYAAMAGTSGDLVSIAQKDEDTSRTGAITMATSGTEGSVTLTAPQAPGDYEVRAWFNGERRLRARVGFTVRGPDLPPEIAANGAPAIALAGTSFPANEKIAVRYAGLPGQSGQYIYVAKAGTPPTSYLSYADAKGTDGVVTIILPAEPGAYEVRAIVGSGVAASQAVSVTVPEGIAMATLTLAKTSFAPGETISVDFAGMSGASNDYVAVAEAGAPYRRYDSYVYTKGETSGRAELKAPTAPGAYEIRAFFKEDATVLRGLVAITVETPP